MLQELLREAAECSGDSSEVPLRYALRLAIPAGAATAELRERIALARARDWHALAAMQFAEHPRPSAAMAPAVVRARRARRLMSAGNVRKALAALSPRTDDIADYAATVSELFPPEPPSCIEPPTDGPLDGPAALRDVVDSSGDLEEAVHSAVGRIKPESAAGPSGLRGEHLRLLLATRPSAIKALAGVISRVISGDLTGPLVSASTLSLVPKGGGAARPIGVGEVLRRIAGRLAIEAATPHLRHLLEHEGQLVLSTSGTARAFSRVAAAHHGATPTWTLQLDMRNAFNEVSRRAVLDAAPTSGPLAPLVRTLYGSPSPLIIPRLRQVRTVDRGVVQGCPLGSALFALALARISTEAGVGLDVQQTWYADDGHVQASDPLQLAEYASRFRAFAQRIGLRLSDGPAGKSRLMAPAGVDRDACGAMARRIGVVHADQLRVLGGLIVSNALDPHERASRLDDHWRGIVKDCTSALEPASALAPQHVVRLLELGGAWPRVAYFASIHGGLPHRHAVTLESLERRLLAHALGDLGDQLLPNVDADRTAANEPVDQVHADLPWLRATLPHALGGLGLRAPTVEAALARDHDPGILAALQAGDNDALNRLTTAKRVAREAALTARLRTVHTDLPSPAARVFDDLLRGSGTAFLRMPAAVHNGTLFEGHAGQVLVAMLLGLRVLPPDRVCETCTAQSARTPIPCDVYGAHLAGCKSVAPTRHNRVRDLLALLLRTGIPHASVVTERHVDATGAPIAPATDTQGSSANRAVDIGYQPPGAATWTCYDIIIGSTAPARADSHAPRDAQAAAFKSLLAHHAREAKAAVLTARDVAKFVKPLAFGAYGGLDRPTYCALSSMCTSVKEAGGSLHFGALVGRLQLAIWHKLVHQTVRLRTGGPARQHTHTSRRPRGRPYRIAPAPAAHPLTLLSAAPQDDDVVPAAPSPADAPHAPPHATTGSPAQAPPAKRGRPPGPRGPRPAAQPATKQRRPAPTSPHPAPRPRGRPPRATLTAPAASSAMTAPAIDPPADPIATADASSSPARTPAQAHPHTTTANQASQPTVQVLHPHDQHYGANLAIATPPALTHTLEPDTDANMTTGHGGTDAQTPNAPMPSMPLIQGVNFYPMMSDDAETF